MLGNFMADSVKGKKYLDYPKDIANGMLLHRFIDHFTDTHDLVKENNAMLRPHFGRYAPLVTDIIYDHFLALYFTEFTGLVLSDYVQEVYDYMQNNHLEMTPFAQEILPYMVKHNWLENYQYQHELHKIFKQFGRRVGVGELFDTVTEVVWLQYDVFEQNFRQFFPVLANAVYEKNLNL
jgi:acyl carrier protein phosphodiesterase